MYLPLKSRLSTEFEVHILVKRSKFYDAGKRSIMYGNQTLDSIRESRSPTSREGTEYGEPAKLWLFDKMQGSKRQHNDLIVELEPRPIIYGAHESFIDIYGRFEPFPGKGKPLFASGASN